MASRSLMALVAVVALASACSTRRPPATPGRPPASAQRGGASWYGIDEAGRATASGEPMDPNRMTAAHRSLPFGSLVRVTDIETGKRVEVIINDRGPFVRGRIIDLSFAAAKALGIVDKGVAPVHIEVIGLEGPLAERRWRVQLGSFTNETTARDLKTRVESTGYAPVSIAPFAQNGVTYYRVWVGEFQERDGAERFRRDLHRDGYSGFVLLAAASAR